jgi:hypothetical protein
MIATTGCTYQKQALQNRHLAAYSLVSAHKDGQTDFKIQ